MQPTDKREPTALETKRDEHDQVLRAFGAWVIGRADFRTVDANSDLFHAARTAFVAGYEARDQRDAEPEVTGTVVEVEKKSGSLIVAVLRRDRANVRVWETAGVAGAVSWKNLIASAVSWRVLS